MHSTAAPYTESRVARLVRNKRVGFPVVEQFLTIKGLICSEKGILFQNSYRSRIHESAIFVEFSGHNLIILRVLRLEVSVWIS